MIILLGLVSSNSSYSVDIFSKKHFQFYYCCCCCCCGVKRCFNREQRHRVISKRAMVWEYSQSMPGVDEECVKRASDDYLKEGGIEFKV